MRYEMKKKKVVKRNTVSFFNLSVFKSVFRKISVPKDFIIFCFTLSLSFFISIQKSFASIEGGSLRLNNNGDNFSIPLNELGYDHLQLLRLSEKSCEDRATLEKVIQEAYTEANQSLNYETVLQGHDLEEGVLVFPVHCGEKVQLVISQVFEEDGISNKIEIVDIDIQEISNPSILSSLYLLDEEIQLADYNVDIDLIECAEVVFVWLGLTTSFIILIPSLPFLYGAIGGIIAVFGFQTGRLIRDGEFSCLKVKHLNSPVS